VTSDPEQARRDKRWKKLQAQPKGGATGALGELMTVFSPGAEHVADEQRRMANTAYQQGTEGDPLGVDLDKGVVRIRRKKS
jgi:hypothetical protein